MNTKISPTLIGMFVIGGFVLIVLAVLVLGSGRFFRQTREFVLYFDSTVNGLHEGAAVKFRGVEIGSVKDIRLRLEQNMEAGRIPVVIEIDQEKIDKEGGTGNVFRDPKAFRAAIEKGVRAQLRTESMVTGVLYIGVDLFPGTPVEYVQPPGGKYTEIPTVPAAMAEIQESATEILAHLREIDFKGLTQSLTETIASAKQLIDSPALKASLQSLEQTMPKVDQAVVGFHKFTTDLDGTIGKLADNLEQTSTATRQAVEQMKVSLKQTETSINNVQALTDPNSPTF